MAKFIDKPSVTKMKSESGLVVSLYIDGKTVPEIAAIYGVSRITTYRLLRHCGAIRKPLALNEGEIIANYRRGESTPKIGQKMGVHKGRIRDILLSGGESLRLQNNLTGNENAVVSDYLKGVGEKAIIGKYNSSSHSLHRVLKDYGVQRKTLSQSCQKYSINESFFDSIDTEEKAYFLGFLYADGYNGERNNSIILTLKSNDIAVLYRLRDRIGSNAPIATRTNKQGRTYSTLLIVNKRLSEQLAKLGCYQKKSLTLTFPNWLNEDMLPHFIRGYVDGDGHIGFNKSQSRFSIVGTLSFTQSISKILSSKCQVYVGIYPHHASSVMQLKVGGRTQIRAVLLFLYRDATLFLERKKLQADQVFIPTTYARRPQGSNHRDSKLLESDVLMIKEMLLIGMRPNEIAPRYGVTQQSIRKIELGKSWSHVTGFIRREPPSRM